MSVGERGISVGDGSQHRKKASLGVEPMPDLTWFLSVR